MNLDNSLFLNRFSHIYVEKQIRDTKRVKEILSYFPYSTVIEIDDYKQIFNRSRQSNAFQYQSQNLILAYKKDQMVYHGSPVCQSFDEEYFYYCSCIMNCIYDCEYCFLKGMYPTANIVVFVNLEDMFSQIEQTLLEHPMYICVSYDSDLLALEPILHYGKMWAEFVQKHDNLTIEIRTKGTYSPAWETIPVCDRVILAFTLSPEKTISDVEKRTPSLEGRLSMLQKAIILGFQVRICFDPMIILNGWKESYAHLVKMIHDEIGFEKIRDISIGTFRLSKNYMGQMRKQYSDSAILQYPYEMDDGFYHLPLKIQSEVEGYMVELLKDYGIEQENIFLWKE